MTEMKIKRDIIKFSKLFDKNSFSPIRSGNISNRYTLKGNKGFLITPSGKKNAELKLKDLVFVSMDGVIKKNQKPSSEWKFHLDLYRNTNCNSVVHAHSKFSVICSCLYKKIPPFHYMVALAGGENIHVAKYALFGSAILSKNILKAIKNRKSCLISNHGQISIGNSIASAYELAEEVEKICEYYYYCKLHRDPKNLSKGEMKQVLKKILDYKQK
jgi:L-fuculose-phosphate aldolase